MGDREMVSMRQREQGVDGGAVERAWERGKKKDAQAMRQKTDRREHADGPPIDSRLGNKVS